MKILFVSHHSGSLINFRGDLIKDIIQKGHTVYTVAPDNTKDEELAKLGVIPYTIQLDKNSLNVLNSIKFVRSLKSYIKKNSFDIIFAYTIKPVIFSALAKRNTNKLILMIEGLGGLFTKPITFKKRVIGRFALLLYRYSFKRAEKIFLLNRDDFEFLTRKTKMEKSKAVIINGIGVNLEYFHNVSVPKDLRFLFIGRLIESKGILDFCNAAKLLKTEFPDVQFDVVGGYDSKDDGVKEKTLLPFISKNIINYHGEVSDVRVIIEKSSVFVLPSYYREGLPRSIMEAMSMGRAIITTNNVGCKETVVNGYNGFLVEPLDYIDLYKKMKKFVINQNLLEQFGQNSRKLCEEKFDVKMINQQILDNIEEVLNG